MDPKLVTEAQERIRAKTPNATCPMCGGTDWTPLTDVVSLMVSTVIDRSRTGLAQQLLPDPPQHGSIDDVSNMSMVRMDVAGFTCNGCGWLRLHM